MSDDRDFSTAKPKYKTFTEYVRAVAVDHNRPHELELLIKCYGTETIERILAGESFNEVTKQP